MGTIVYQEKNGVKYAYESVSYWNAEKKAPPARRRRKPGGGGEERSAPGRRASETLETAEFYES